MRKLIVVVAIAMMVMPIHVLASLQPIVITLNTPNEKWERWKRANKPNSMYIHLSNDKEIPAYNWYRVWLPIDEADKDFKNICDGLKPITGGMEDPRFVPNVKYFEKYPDSPEKDYGKLYTLKRGKLGKVEFYDAENCPGVKNRLIPDPSGLGHWITGTVMPKLERDEKKREKAIIEIGEHFDMCDPG
jgi:hypothetical protein